MHVTVSFQVNLGGVIIYIFEFIQNISRTLIPFLNNTKDPQYALLSDSLCYVRVASAIDKKNQGGFYLTCDQSRFTIFIHQACLTMAFNLEQRALTKVINNHSMLKKSQRVKSNHWVSSEKGQGQRPCSQNVDSYRCVLPYALK